MEDIREKRGIQMEESKGKIVQIWKETPDVKTFKIELEKQISFKPGQYCMVSLPDREDLEDIERPLTPSNPTLKGNLIEITVKKIGLFTSALHESFVGDTVKIRGPLGDALVFDKSIDEDIVYLTGGSGITPFISHIRYALANGLPNKFYLIFGNVTEEDIIYRNELDEIKRYDNFTIIYTINENISDDWEGETGYIDKEMIERYIDDPKEKIWYVCGPPPMMASMRELLTDLEISEKNWMMDSWEIPGKHD